MNNDQVMIYYIKSRPPIGEPEAPYQGEIRRIVPAVQGYEPVMQDIIDFHPQEEIDSIFAIRMCLN
jgi:hypothetical protein